MVNKYSRFLLAGLVLGLFTEAELKLVAGIKPAGFVVAVFAYPVLVSLAYAGSKWIDRVVASRWIGDLIHYVGSAVVGLAVEWTVLGTGPGSNAIQIGMVGMWTTFCFGPRVLTRFGVSENPARRFWLAFAVVAVVVTVSIVLTPDAKAKVVVAVLTLSAAYVLWSVWLLIMAWRSRSRG